MSDRSYIEKAQDSLDSILKNQSTKNQSSAKTAKVSVSVARSNPLYTPVTGRTKTRVLFVTTDLSILTQTTKSLDGFTAISDMFHEVHIMVLRTGIPAKYPVLRVAANTWLYTVTAKHTWQLPLAAWKLMKQELEFAGGFRPDLLVARDSGVSALVVYGASLLYDRPRQLQLSATVSILSKWWKKQFRNWLEGQFLSVRTTTDELGEAFKKRHPQITDIATLPRFRDYVSLFSGQPGSLLQQKYPQFNFIILYVGEITATSNAFYAIDASRNVLRNPRSGLVLVGNGKGLMECAKRAELLGIKDQVIIEKRTDNLNEYIASADVLLVTDTNAAADELVLYGAAAGAAMVMTKTPLRNDLFVDGESAYLVGDARSGRISEGLVDLLNNHTKRLQMRQAARVVAEKRLHIDPVIYQEEYRQSIESALFTNPA